jgi:hypothetical protein
MNRDVLWTETAVKDFSSFTPSDEDIEIIKTTLEQIVQRSGSIVPIKIPFQSKELGNLYLAVTPDNKWQIVFKSEPPDNLVVFTVIHAQTR